MGRRRAPRRQRLTTRPALALGLVLGLGSALAACDGDNVVEPRYDMAPDAAVITGRPDLGPAPAPAVPGALGMQIEAFGGEVGFFAMNLETGEAMAHGGTVRFPAGGLSALFVVTAYAAQVDAGSLRADRQVQLRPNDVRGVGLDANDAGKTLPLSELAARALDGDRTAESVLARVIEGDGADGHPVIDGTVAAFDIDGIGAYLDPCARDRLYAEALDARFAAVDCADLAGWLYTDSVTGLVPELFPSRPTFDDAQRAAAAAARLAGADGTVTARAMARVLALLDAGNLYTPSVDARVRAILDGSRAAGGGDDGLPARVWAGSMEGLLADGRHWAGRIRGAAGESFVLVVLNTGGEAIDGLSRALGSGAWSTLIGEIPWPPMSPAEPGGASVALTDVARAADCDDEPGGLEGQIMCRTDAAAEVFASGDAVTANLMVPGPGPLESAWIWSNPAGERVRTQARLARSAWWVWTETRRLFAAGSWSVTVSVDGSVVRHAPFTVQGE